MTTKPKAHWSEALIALNACREAVEWAKDQPSLAVAWKTCERGDWMLWLAGRVSGPVGSASRKKLVLAACECARLALPHAKGPEALAAIETAESYARGEGATLEDVRKVAAYASYAAAASASAYASYAAAASASASAYARKETLAHCADIARKHYPKHPTIKVKS